MSSDHVGKRFIGPLTRWYTDRLYGHFRLPDDTRAMVRLADFHAAGLEPVRWEVFEFSIVGFNERGKPLAGDLRLAPPEEWGAA